MSGYETKIPVRSNGIPFIDASWFNTIRTALIDLGNTGYRAITAAAYTAVSADYAIDLDTSINDVDVTLPSAAAVEAGKSYSLKCTDITNEAKVSTDGAETIDGMAEYIFQTKYETLNIMSNGTNWRVNNYS